MLATTTEVTFGGNLIIGVDEISTPATLLPPFSTRQL
jgi:hypothetical protein